MIIDIKILDKFCKIDLSQPIDISLTSKKENSFKSWYREEIKINTITQGDFIGSVISGGPVNFSEIIINPHANMTHTESVGHICDKIVSINNVLKQFHFSSQLITVEPKEIKEDNNLHKKGDKVIMLDQIKKLEEKLKEIDSHYEQRIDVIKKTWSETYNDTVEAIEILKRGCHEQ